MIKNGEYLYTMIGSYLNFWYLRECKQVLVGVLFSVSVKNFERHLIISEFRK
jgi:hypothetical protein